MQAGEGDDEGAIETGVHGFLIPPEWWTEDGIQLLYRLSAACVGAGGRCGRGVKDNAAHDRGRTARVVAENPVHRLPDQSGAQILTAEEHDDPVRQLSSPAREASSWRRPVTFCERPVGDRRRAWSRPPE